MVKVDKSVAPYYDDFNAQKQYFQILALPGRVAQAREITQMQSIIMETVKNIGNVFLRNGSVVEGCQVVVAPDKKSVTVGSGSVYLEGTVLTVKESTVVISGTGVEKIGIKLLETIVDESKDETLRDPAQGYDNYDQPGAHRLKRATQVVVNDADSAVISTLVEGVPVIETAKPEFDGIEKVMARRTHDESGSYVVDGLRVRVEPNNAEFYNVVVEAGKAYVLGFELRKPAATRIPSPKSLATSTVTASNYMFTTANSMYMLDSNPYVKDILEVRGTASFTESQSLTTNVDAVLLSQLDVIRVTSVTQGGVTYQVGSGSGDGDCYLMRSGTRYYLKWNGANAPVSGQSYAVTYEHAKLFTKGVDYKLTLKSNAHYLEWLAGGVKPLDSTNLTVSYQQYLARKDVVYLDHYGQVFITHGTPAEAGFETTPEVPVNTLGLAVIHNPPNGDASDNAETYDIFVENVGLTRFTMKDIFNLVERVRRNEYDQALIALNDDARQRNTAGMKKGIITDPISDFSKIDVTYNRNADGEKITPSLPLFDVALNFTTAFITLPIINHVVPADVDSPNSLIRKYDRLAGLPATGEKVIMSQALATKSFLVNPYSMFPQLPEISISPAVDTWIEQETIIVPKSLTQTAVISTTTRNVDQFVAGNWGNNGRVIGSSVSDQHAGTTTTTRSFIDLLREEAITYCRHQTITVKGTRFSPGLDKIECRFDGKLVNLTPINGTQPGTPTTVKTVRADGNGNVHATFEIPPNIRTGVREVELSSPIIIDGYNNTGFTIYQAQGIRRVYQQTIETLTTVLIRRTVTQTIQRSYDPVAQSFITDRDTLLKGVDVYFEAKSDNVAVNLEIREMQNGQITSTILGSQTLSAQQVAISSDAQVATRFNFPDPVWLSANVEYAFVVRSASDAYRIWVAELGGKDVKSGNLVIKNPYLDGVMMSSSNNTTWSAHQTMDIKFRLLEDVYEAKGTLMFKNLNVSQASRLMLTADQVVPQGCDVRWHYQVNNNNVWHPIAPYNLMELAYTFDAVAFKAELTRTGDTNITPLIALDSVHAQTSLYDTSGSYIGNSVQGVDPYKNADIIVNTYIPANTTLVVLASKDDGATWQSTTLDPLATRNLNNDWKEMTFKAQFPTEVTKFKLRIDVTTSDQATSPRFSSIRCILS